MWDFTALAIAHKYRVIALDQRGHGDSDWSPKQEYGLEPMQRDLENVTRALGLDRFIIMGLSMGGRNSYAFTARHPEKIAALIVVDVGPEGNRAGAQRIRQFTSQEDIMPTFDSFVERTMRYVPNREEWMVRGSLRNNLKQLPDGRWTWKYDPFLRGPNRPLPSPQSQQADPERNWREWRSITCPILIVRGEQTDILPADVARKMADLHPGHAKLVEVPRAGHLVPGDNPLGFEKVFLPFMDELEKKGITRR
jgi:pimeloyl-ACP methyl ester carboxylesterase